MSHATQVWKRIESQLPDDERGSCDECKLEPLPKVFWSSGVETLCPSCYSDLVGWEDETPPGLEDAGGSGVEYPSR